jgi:hypothetical protein
LRDTTGTPPKAASSADGKVWDDTFSPSDHIAVFLCREFSLSDVHSSEIRNQHFFDLDSLSDEVSPTTRRRLREYLAGDGPARMTAW